MKMKSGCITSTIPVIQIRAADIFTKSNVSDQNKLKKTTPVTIWVVKDTHLTDATGRIANFDRK